MEGVSFHFLCECAYIPVVYKHTLANTRKPQKSITRSDVGSVNSFKALAFCCTNGKYCSKFVYIYIYMYLHMKHTFLSNSCVIRNGSRDSALYLTEINQLEKFQSA